MRYDTEHKQKTRATVLQAAAKAIRADGPDRVGVAGVMAEAGLTHGGFYAHFKSKDELVAAAIGQMFEDARARLEHDTAGRSPAEGLAAYIDFYLSKKHRDARSFGCPMAALASDVPRLADPAREQFVTGVRQSTIRLGEKLAGLGHAAAEAEARSMMAELIGALSLARIETDAKRSDAILAASRAQLKQRFGLPS
ncbi:TetR/AcrR family transcriptional regulator [Rhodanobacter glycinis]|uniref:TetR/AcrR family transcriptional regulator n=2 Tax=Rhodanobacter TaxID=75309 RepID=A0A502F9W6_9GAMM|nr:TetR/AcrR family transcriptional regulator [Rhodanobacter glycinis]TPG07252.1 TetR/AcrR family transcriptional regulator [Rhodanobacter glycinis]TPG46094.1 TetR/AcrR family transcriptional regulator [Rhodanobacter glycinis]